MFGWSGAHTFRAKCASKMDWNMDMEHWMAQILDDIDCEGVHGGQSGCWTAIQCPNLRIS